MQHDTRRLTVAVLGAGTVGSHVLRLLKDNGEEFAHRVGARLEVIGIAVSNDTKDRGPHVDPSLYRSDHTALVQEADIVVEVMGGIEPALCLVLAAIESGASVITANKALLATEGQRLFEAASRHGVDLAFEAAVAGAVPLIRPIRDSLAGDKVQRVLGIVNGTTNYILDSMTRHGLSFAEALAQAQDLGYAEADPRADVEGLDAAAKASILASLAFHSRVTRDDVYVEGITRITERDVRAAQRMQRVLKLVSIVEKITDDSGQECLSSRVYPVMIPASHPLASVGEAYNAIFVEAEAAGRLMFYGQGAGGAPTASAVLGDLVTVARNRIMGGKSVGESAHAGLVSVGIEHVQGAAYISLRVDDRPGVLARIAGTMTEHGISIATIHQELDGDDGASVEIVTHRARESAFVEVLADLARATGVRSIDSFVRMEGE